MVNDCNGAYVAIAFSEVSGIKKKIQATLAIWKTHPGSSVFSNGIANLGSKPHHLRLPQHRSSHTNRVCATTCSGEGQS